MHFTSNPNGGFNSRFSYYFDANVVELLGFLLLLALAVATFVNLKSAKAGQDSKVIQRTD